MPPLYKVFCTTTVSSQTIYQSNYVSIELFINFWLAALWLTVVLGLWGHASESQPWGYPSLTHSHWCWYPSLTPLSLLLISFTNPLSLLLISFTNPLSLVSYCWLGLISFTNSFSEGYHLTNHISWWRAATFLCITPTFYPGKEFWLGDCYPW